MLAEEQASEERSCMSEERRNQLLTLASRLESEVKTVEKTVTGSAASASAQVGATRGNP